MNTPMLNFVIYGSFVFGLVSVLLSAYQALKRKRRLERLGLVIEDDKADKTSRFAEVAEQLSGLLAASQEELVDKFNAAGFYNSKLAYLFLPLKYTLLVFGLVIAVLATIYLDMAVKNALLYGLFWLIAVIILPDAYLAMRTRKLRQKLSSRLPYLLDLMAVCVQTGMTIEASMSYLALEMVSFDRDMAYLLKKTNDRARIVGMEQALSELYERVPTAEIRSFVMTLNQSLQYGSSIYEVLTNLSKDLRETQMLGLEEKVGKLSAKMSAPLVLFIMFPIVILIVAPGIMRLM